MLSLAGCPSDPCLGLSNAVVEVELLEPYAVDGGYPADDYVYQTWLEEADRPCGDALPWSDPLELTVEVERHERSYYSDPGESSCQFGASPTSLTGPGESWQPGDEAPLLPLPGASLGLYRPAYDGVLVAQGEVAVDGACTGVLTVLVVAEGAASGAPPFEPAIAGARPPWRVMRYFEALSSCDAALGALPYGYCVDAFAAELRLVGRAR